MSATSQGLAKVVRWAHGLPARSLFTTGSVRGSATTTLPSVLCHCHSNLPTSWLISRRINLSFYLFFLPSSLPLSFSWRSSSSSSSSCSSACSERDTLLGETWSLLICFKRRLRSIAYYRLFGYFDVYRGIEAFGAVDIETYGQSL